MPETKACAWTLSLLVGAALLFHGCGGPPAVIEPVDARYLSEWRDQGTLYFAVKFVKFDPAEWSLAEQAWSEADELDAVEGWRDNGLRAVTGGARAAKTINRLLERGATVEVARRQLVMPVGRSFRVALGRDPGERGLAWTDGDVTSYRDVSDLRLGLRVLPLGGAPGEVKVALTPFFEEGPEGAATFLEGLSATLAVEEDGLILVAPVRDGEGVRLGSVLRSSGGEDGPLVTMCLVEPHRSGRE